MLEQLVWPAAELIFGLGFVLICRSPITRLIDRISKVGPIGLTATPTTQESANGPEPPELTNFSKSSTTPSLSSTKPL